ncbi:MAG: hypothetical protein ACLUFH_13580 [Monoglobales bacterium]|uniref:hypothetical protein n=1 Tax=Candidatus Ventrimonas sp. TaxID=3048889 RepID=UPI003A364B4B
MIHIFDLLEFQVLAAASGMEQYYGFSCFGHSETEAEEIVYAVYRLLQDGILKQEGQDLVIQPPIRELLNTVRNSRMVVTVDPGAANAQEPGQCLYWDKGKIVCAEEKYREKGKIGFSLISEDELKCQMKELGHLPEKKLTEDMGAFSMDEYWKKIPENLSWLLSLGLSAETESLQDQERIHSLFSLREKESGTVRMRILVLDFAMEYAMVIQREGQPGEIQNYCPEEIFHCLFHEKEE